MACSYDRSNKHYIMFIVLYIFQPFSTECQKKSRKRFLFSFSRSAFGKKTRVILLNQSDIKPETFVTCFVSQLIGSL